MQGIVLYCDGGCRGGNPGKGGSGIHGYVYSYLTPIRGSGHPTHVPTNQGYKKKTEFKKHDEKKILPKENDKDATVTQADMQTVYELPHGAEIKVEHYIDRLITFPDKVTNNHAELVGMIECLKMIRERSYDVFQCVIYCDSQYVVNGVNEWMHKWSKTTWRKPDGSWIPNWALWKRIYDLYKCLIEDGERRIDIRWVKGHNGDFGNEQSDKLATLAISMPHPEHIDTYRVISQDNVADGHWKKNIEPCDFFSHKYLMFNPALPNPKNVFVGVHIDSKQGIRYLGSHHANTAYNIIEITDDEYAKDAIAMVLDVIEMHSVHLNYCNVVCLLDTSVLFNKDVLAAYQQFGRAVFQIDPKGHPDLLTYAMESTGSVVSHIMNPAFLSYEAEGRVREMFIFSDLMREEKDILGIAKTDITDLLYETKVNKKGVEEMSILSKWVPGSSIIDCQVKYCDVTTEPYSEKEEKVIMTFGQDLPDRNTLKRLENHKPKVVVMTSSEIPYYFQYGVAVQTTVGNVFSMAGSSHSRFVNPNGKSQNENSN